MNLTRLYSAIHGLTSECLFAQQSLDNAHWMIAGPRECWHQKASMFVSNLMLMERGTELGNRNFGIGLIPLHGIPSVVLLVGPSTQA
jgi:hypothetical protein